MLYSVFNWNTLRYEVYRSNTGPRPGERAQPRQRYNDAMDGDVRPEDLLPILPADAVYQGSSDFAQGRVAVLEQDATADAPGGFVDASALTGYGASAGEVASTGFQSLLVIGLALGALYYTYKLIEGGSHERRRPY